MLHLAAVDGASEVVSWERLTGKEHPTAAVFNKFTAIDHLAVVAHSYIFAPPPQNPNNLPFISFSELPWLGDLYGPNNSLAKSYVNGTLTFYDLTTAPVYRRKDFDARTVFN